MKKIIKTLAAALCLLIMATGTGSSAEPSEFTLLFSGNLSGAIEAHRH